MTWRTRASESSGTTGRCTRSRASAPASAGRSIPILRCRSRRNQRVCGDAPTRDWWNGRKQRRPSQMNAPGRSQQGCGQGMRADALNVEAEDLHGSGREIERGRLGHQPHQESTCRPRVAPCERAHSVRSGCRLVAFRRHGHRLALQLRPPFSARQVLRARACRCPSKEGGTLTRTCCAEVRLGRCALVGM
jgi:hypothetical protein